MMEENTFKKRYYGNDLTEYNKAHERTSNLWNILQNIEKHYKEYSKRCEDTAKRLMNDILDADELAFIHSVRFRIKNPISLCKKFIKKKAELPISIPNEPAEAEKYRYCDETNYFKIFTDLGGVRILVRYRSEWSKVDSWIRNKFKELFVTNWLDDYESAPMVNFIAEKPKVYYKHSEEDYYGQLDKNKFDLKKSKEEYNSFHYIINYNGVYLELQVRTILDEAWGECTHDILYKGEQPDKELKIMAKCLSEQVKAAETITEIIYEKIHKSQRKRKNNVSNNGNQTSLTSDNTEDALIKKKIESFHKKLNYKLNNEQGNK